MQAQFCNVHVYFFQICQVTLQLFDVLLSSPLSCVLQELFLSHWSPVGTHPGSVPITAQTSPTHSNSIASSTTHTDSPPVTAHTSPNSKTPSTLTFVSEENLSPVKKELEEQMKDYLSLLPESLLSCEQVSGSLGLEQYLFEAHQQVYCCVTACTPLSSSRNQIHCFTFPKFGV